MYRVPKRKLCRSRHSKFKPKQDGHTHVLIMLKDN